MISVIMPTIWKAPHYKQMLPILNDHPLVGEIVVIDNDPINTDQDIFSLTKLKYHPQPQNLYVNPSWNLGAKIANYDILCLYSDDMYFDITSLELIHNHINETVGVVGFGTSSINPTEKPQSILNIRALDVMHFQYGICMFMHKTSYYQIPDVYKIYCGDQFIWDKNVQNNKLNYQILNGYALTNMHTSSGMFQGILNQDFSHYFADHNEILKSN